MATKTCTNCKTERDVTQFGKKGKSSWCKPCDSEYAKKYRAANKAKLAAKRAEWEEKNADKMKDYYKDYYNKHREAILINKHDYHIANKQHINDRQKRWYIENAEWVKARVNARIDNMNDAEKETERRKRNEYELRRLRSDLDFKMRKILSSRKMTMQWNCLGAILIPSRLILNSSSQRP